MQIKINKTQFEKKTPKFFQHIIKGKLYIRRNNLGQIEYNININITNLLQVIDIFFIK